jgi:hypothetical protein
MKFSLKNTERISIKERFKIGGVYASPWTPSLLTTIAWYDASNASSIVSSGSSVSQWNDIGSSATYHLTQTNAALQFSTGTRTLNSLNVMDSTGDWMSYATFPVPSSGDISILGVCVVDAIATLNDSLWSMDGTNDYQFDSNSGTAFNGRILVTGIGSSVSFTGGPFPGPSIYATIFDYNGEGKYRGWVDGTSHASSNYTTKLSTSQVLGILTNRAKNRPFNGAVGEVVIFETCDSTCRQLVEGYLAWKWGLVDNLPADHPYKNARPLSS